MELMSSCSGGCFLRNVEWNGNAELSQWTKRDVDANFRPVRYAASCHRYRQAFAERGKCCLDVGQARMVVEVQQPGLPSCGSEPAPARHLI